MGVQVVDALFKARLQHVLTGALAVKGHPAALEGAAGDGQLCAETAMLLLDCREFYRKWLGDIADCQCKKSGHVQHTAPLMGGGGGPGGWGCAIVLVPWAYYLQFGEKEMLEKINKLGIGPGGLGGTTTALAVNINTYPTHIAGLPVAVNICCHVNRHAVRTI